ncbi:lysozyme inhibitor LprI family protein [Vibrio cionasavignyae]|uniref:lysozyme inhibitor LprI family protein n=1 Tax=Vibrio cionasavignyae TaxID=2910252 RepID=UPI003D10C833
MNVKLCVFLIFFWSLNAFSGGDLVDPCLAKNGGATAGYLCVDKKIKSVDVELNESYKRAINRILVEDPDLEESFREAQRAWLKFKDSECKFIGSSLTSSPWRGVQIEECKLQMMKERIVYFNQVFVG